jgi:cytidylate kinase
MIVTIDGPAGSGKSTAARNLARALGVAFLETGATYRAAALKAMRRGVDFADEAALARVVRGADIDVIPAEGGPRVLLDGEDVSEAIRSAAVTEKSSRLARSPAVRGVLVSLQRRIGRRLGSFVAEGRDQGTVVFPEADVKFYLDAEAAERARRRLAEMHERGEAADHGEVLAAIIERDRRDRSRPVAPLVKPPGAIVVDTSANTPEQTLAALLGHVRAAVSRGRPAGPRSHPNSLLRGWRPPGGEPAPSLYYRLMRRFFQVSMCAMWKVRVFNRHHEPARGGALYVCNHQSFLDPMLMSFALRRPMNYMARESLFSGALGRVIRSLNAFPVRTDGAGTAAVREAMRRLRGGGQLVVFPEGTRTWDGRIGRFLPGMALLAQRAAAWTVPVLIDGAFEAWPRTKRLPSPGSVVVEYAPPIARADARAVEPAAFMEQVRRTLVELQADVRRRTARPPLSYAGRRAAQQGADHE